MQKSFINRVLSYLWRGINNMKLNSHKIKFILIFIIISFMPLIAVHGSTLYITYISAGANPIVDGNLSDLPWSEFSYRGVRLYNFTNEEDYIDIEFMGLYNDTTKTVSFAIRIPTTYSNDIFKMTFDTNNSFFYLRLFESSPWIFIEGNDQKEFNLVDDIKTDCVTTGQLLETEPDTSVGGTNDFYGKAIHDGTHFNIEMTIPQNSGDVEGCDVELETNNNTGILLWYYDDSTQTTYGPIYSASNTRDRHRLVISGRNPYTLPITPLFIIGSLITTLLIVTFVYRRRKIKARK